MEEETRPNPRNGWPPQLYYRLDLEAMSEALGISSATGISDRPSSTGIGDQSNSTDTTPRTSKSTTNDPSIVSNPWPTWSRAANSKAASKPHHGQVARIRIVGGGEARFGAPT